MSRPCFALSVMLCCMAGPLLIIGKTHARDSVVSPGHDPGECIVCPLAHGPLEPCGGYSDYDYNRYWYDESLPPAPTAATPADPELEVAQSLTDDLSEDAWESSYEDYYSDYVYGDGVTGGDAEEATLDATPAPAALADPVTAPAPTPAPSSEEEHSEFYDEFGWYSDAPVAAGDELETSDDCEPLDASVPTASSPEAATAAEATIDYEAYEEEWFSYGTEPSAQEPDLKPEADEARETSSEPASQSDREETIEAQPEEENWGDEETWYEEEYGYEGSVDEVEEIETAVRDAEPMDQLETGYDEAYDEAMVTDVEAVEPAMAMDVVPASPDMESAEPVADDAFDYESFYDAYDDLYNYETAPLAPTEAAESIEPEAGEATIGLAINEQPPTEADSEPAWLAALVHRMLSPVRMAAEGIASSPSAIGRDSQTASHDECSQEWDCESGYWAEPQTERSPLVLSAADTLDEMAAVLQSAAEYLRGVASGHLAEATPASKGSHR